MFEKAMEGDVLDRLNGRYPVGPQLPNGEPEFGWRQHDISQHPPIQAEAAREIKKLREDNYQLVGKAAAALKDLDFMRTQFAELAAQAIIAQQAAVEAQRIAKLAIADRDETHAEAERLLTNLNGRDKFIVDQGLWLDFVDQLPK